MIDWGFYDFKSYEQLECDLSVLSSDERIDALGNLLCQEFYSLDHVEHIKKVLLIFKKLECKAGGS